MQRIAYIVPSKLCKLLIILTNTMAMELHSSYRSVVRFYSSALVLSWGAAH